MTAHKTESSGRRSDLRRNWTRVGRRMTLGPGNESIWNKYKSDMKFHKILIKMHKNDQVDESSKKWIMKGGTECTSLRQLFQEWQSKLYSLDGRYFTKTCRNAQNLLSASRTRKDLFFETQAHELYEGHFFRAKCVAGTRSWMYKSTLKRLIHDRLSTNQELSQLCS